MSTVLRLKFPCALLWFPVSGNGSSVETFHKNGELLVVERLQTVPYAPRNVHDFISEHRLENLGMYARLYETSHERFDILSTTDYGSDHGHT